MKVLGWVCLGLSFVVSACREDCAESARMGDFEFSQGNYVNAIRHYEHAISVEANCGVVKDKLAEAKRKAISAP
jgi:hypothetical protein